MLITTCVVFHVMGLMALSKLLSSLAKWLAMAAGHLVLLKNMLLLIAAVLFCILIHVIEIVLWAITYMKVGEFDSFIQAVYFSTITATTLGYGDITLSEQHQLLSGFEAIGGLILFGLTTAFFLKLVTIFFQDHDFNYPKEPL